jgi:predicted homoserine dehydrogenase-like protein
VIIVDRALAARAQRGSPVGVGLVGAGFMGRGIALQIHRYTPGMALAGLVCRTLGKARRACEEAGLAWREVASGAELDRASAAGACGIATDPGVLAEARAVEAVVEATGSVEYGAGVALQAIAGGKHLVLMNAELDGTLGPLLKRRAEQAGLVYSNADGDQPGVIMNLYRFVRGIGVRPVLCGNIKGLHDPYRNPTTQAGFAARWGQNPEMVTAFADGTKISFEQAIVANATGMGVARRGMMGPTVPAGTPIEQAAARFPEAILRSGPGIVDYVVGAAPSPGVFVLGEIDDPRQRHYLALYKMSDGPFYCFYTPYHLCHFEVPTTVARAVLLGDPAIAPLAGPVVEVVAAAKVDLAPGDVLDGLGGYRLYGLCESYAESRRQGLLPIGLAAGCRVTRAVARDGVLAVTDVERPPGRLCDRLRAEQDALFPP